MNIYKFPLISLFILAGLFFFASPTLVYPVAGRRKFSLPAVLFALTFFLVVAFFSIEPAYGATEFTATVMQSGGDYSTLNTWETGVQTDLTSAATQVFSGTKTGTVADNTVVYLCRGGVYQSHSGTTVHATSTQILVELISGAATEQSGDIWYTNNTCDSANYFTISDGGDSAIAIAQIDGAWTSADTTAVTIGGWTTDATHYIKIYTTAAARHDGKWNEGKYRLDVLMYYTYTFAISIEELHVRVEGLQFGVNEQDRPSPSWNNYGIFIGPSDSDGAVWEISDNIVYFYGEPDVALAVMYGIRAAPPTVSPVVTPILRYWNNIIINNTTGPSAGLGTGLSSEHRQQNAYIYNNTFAKWAVGTSGDNNSTRLHYLKNNLFYSCAVATSGSHVNTRCDYNATDLADLGYTAGANDRVSQTFTFAGADDFHLALTDLGARGYGLSQYTDANCPVTTDIDGNYRRPNGEVTDIGADEDIDTLDSVSVRISNIQQTGTRYTTLSAWEADRDGDITGYYPEVAQIDGAWTAADTTAVTIDGWTTDATHYIKIYTTTAARHDGKWNEGKYRMVFTATASPFYGIDIPTGTQTYIEGLQFSIDANGYNETCIIKGLTWAGFNTVTISESIFKKTSTDTLATVGISKVGDGDMKIKNCIGYDFGTGTWARFINIELGTGYVYNCTAYNNTTGFMRDGGTFIAKNNISYNNTDNYYGTFNATSTNNLSGNNQGDAPGSNPRNLGAGETITFVNESGDDFHLALADLGARGYGLSQYADTNLPVTDDIDGNYRRPNGEVTDIGADEDIDTLDSVSVRISNIQQSGTRYTTLSGWEADRNGNLTGYYPEIAQIDGAWTAADTTAVTIDGWTTDATHYIKIYTTAAARHDGKWNTGKYRLEAIGEDMFNVILVYESNVRVDGLQMRNVSTSGWTANGMSFIGNQDDIQLSNNIIRYSGSNNTGGAGIGMGEENYTGIKIWNNIIYDFDAAGYTGGGIGTWDATGYIYNNTIIGNSTGISSSWQSALILKNNLVYNNLDNYNVSLIEGSTNNLSGNNQLDAPGTNPRNLVTGETITFADEAGDDFHLASNDAGARNYGTDLSADTYLPFSTDIDGETRSGSWDIGADELIRAWYDIKGTVKLKGDVKFK